MSIVNKEQLGQTSATLVVAASDSKKKSGADYICDGTVTRTMLDDCEDAWDEYVDSDVVSGTDDTDYRQGSKSVKLQVGAGVGAGAILATEAIPSTDISDYYELKFFIKSDIDISIGDLQILLSDQPNCANPVETIDISAAAGIWGRRESQLANPSSDTNIVSIGIKQVTDIGACTLLIDYVRCEYGDERTINNALNALTSNGGKIVLLDGNYTIAGRIIGERVTTDNFTIEGQGWGTIIKPDAGCPDGAGYNILVPYGNAKDGIVIRGLYVNGNGEGITSGMEFHNSTRILIDCVKVSDIQSSDSDFGYGIYFLDCTGVWVRDCYIHNIAARDGIQFKGMYEGLVENCIIDTCTLYGIDSHAGLRGVGRRIIIKHNRISNVLTGINVCEPYSIIDGNIISSIIVTGIDLRGNTDPSGTVICNNKILDGGGDAVISLYHASGATDIVIANNFIDATGQAAGKDGIFNSAHAAIIGNTIRNTARHGIYIAQSDCTLVGNIITNAGGSPIDLTSKTNCIAIGNIGVPVNCGGAGTECVHNT